MMPGAPWPALLQKAIGKPCRGSSLRRTVLADIDGFKLLEIIGLEMDIPVISAVLFHPCICLPVARTPHTDPTCLQ